ncbi:hypothetical protein BHE74_00008188 [Ensete ventricosum]|uniref:Uncharacterized protein n=1 Tax=Ensete ventricosum TaxID=4639 RepID=A0A427BCK4_ENSVE|nr:hypothetical protein B296_00000934 [Ensete ventricosum]RWW83307.1 hypothetical protein BHE74_00008188 [Ensete ventricosum]RZR99048.1 hypothetical protein BHM03_00028519 [Ensete ventricosum]
MPMLTHLILVVTQGMRFCSYAWVLWELHFCLVFFSSFGRKRRGKSNMLVF